tara:strand:- start:1871 stop:2389 length:519 start_codon:yes stop_codon:yes gene_type:complete
MIIDSNTIAKIVFKDVFNNKLPHVEFLKNTIASALPDNALRLIMHVILNENETFKILHKNDYFKVKHNADCISSIIHDKELDILSDMGLYEDGYLYGKILNSADYSSQFNEYHYSMDVQLFLYNPDIEINMLKEMDIHMCEIKTWELIKINKSEIKYFNVKNKNKILNDANK